MKKETRKNIGACVAVVSAVTGAFELGLAFYDRIKSARKSKKPSEPVVETEATEAESIEVSVEETPNKEKTE